MSKVNILNGDVNSPLINELSSLFASEWSDFKVSDLGISNTEIPLPLVMCSDEQVVGGLAFTQFAEPGFDHTVVWLNALYIQPDYRGMGLASQLIQHAQSELKDSQRWLYVYTNVPSLYGSLGWSVIEADSELNHKVLRVSLLSQPHA